MANKKDKLTTAILGCPALFGCFGLHRFYLGQIGLGIAYLLGSLTFIGLIITWPASFIDFIGFLIMPQETFDRKYNPEFYNQQIGLMNKPIGTGNVNVADELHKLDLLFKRGVITFEEFERRKAQLLNS